MTTQVAGGKTAGMPRNPRDPAMTPEEFRALLEAAGLTVRQAADILGVGRATISRWQTEGDKGTPISVHSAKLIRLLIKPKTKKK